MTQFIFNGKFSKQLGKKELFKGMRGSEYSSRTSNAISGINGLIPDGDALHEQDALSRIDTDVITDSFPYPQLLSLKNYVLVCGETEIYEWNGSSLTLKITASQAGTLWSYADFYNFVYLSNGKVAIRRNAQSGVFSETTDPVTNMILGYNGRVFVSGATS